MEDNHMSEEKNQNEIEEVTNEDEHKDVEHYCYLCRRPESVAGKDVRTSE